jgi:PAS domain S-box-containing protein
MVPVTALCFFLTGTAVLFLRHPHLAGPSRWLARGLALFVVAASATTLLEYLLGRGLWIDWLFPNSLLDTPDGFRPGRSAPGAALAFLALGWALLTLEGAAPAARMAVAESLASVAGIVGMLALAGYVYGATALYAMPLTYPGMAPHSAVGLLVLSAGVLSIRPDLPLIVLLFSPRAGGVMVRRLLIGALAIPTLGLLVMLGARSSLYGHPFAAALLAVAAMVIAIALVVSTGHTLDRLDAARAASERAVAEREERLRDLIDQASDAIMIGNFDGRYTEVNDAACRMLGYRREELVGQTITDLIPPADVPRLKQSRATLLRGAIDVDEWEFRKRDGTYLPVEVSAKILRDGRWQAMVRDISARRETERASTAVAEAVTVTPQSSVDAVLQTVAVEAQHVADAEYVAVGLGGREDQPFEPWVFVGLPPERSAAIERTPRAIGVLGAVALEDRVIRVADVRRDPAFSGFPPHHPEMTSFLGVPIRSRGRPIGILYLANKRGAAAFSLEDERNIERLAARAGTAIETARLYQAEGLLRAWLEAMIDQIPEGVILTNADGSSHSENRSIQAFAHDTGRRDRLGHAVRYDLRLPDGRPVPPDDEPRIRALIDGTATMRRELALRHPDGRLVPMLVSAAPVLDAQGRRSGAVAIYQDISTLKELERLREEWSSAVAHDLRQPVGIISVGTGLLASQLDRGQLDDARTVLERIRQSTTRLNRMITDLLDVSRIGARRLTLERIETDLVPWLDDAAGRLAMLAPGNPVRLRTEVDRAGAFIDPMRIEQVLGNLISNAAKYGEPGADITIRLASADDHFEVGVTSRGPGILPAELPMLFHRFSRTDAARKGATPGLGLGLYICKGLVEAHGGTIRATSEPGAETTFTFTIPGVAAGIRHVKPDSEERRAA